MFLSLFFSGYHKAKDYIFAHKYIKEKKTEEISHRPNPKDFIAKQTSFFLLSHLHVKYSQLLLLFLPQFSQENLKAFLIPSSSHNCVLIKHTKEEE